MTDRSPTGGIDTSEFDQTTIGGGATATAEDEAKTATRPFHESIVDALMNVQFRDQLNTLGTLIVATKIPKNHGNIVEAFMLQLDEFMARDKDGVIPKLEAEAAEAAKLQGDGEEEAGGEPETPEPPTGDEPDGDGPEELGDEESEEEE